MWKTQGLCQRPLSQIAVSAQSRRPLACFLRSRAGASAIILVAAARNVNSVFPSQGGGEPSPPYKARISYIKTCSNSKPPWGGSEPQVGHQSVPNGPPKLAFCSIWETCIVPNLKNMVCATDSLFTMFLHENAIWNCANTVEICAFGCIPDAAPFFSLHLC